MTKRISNKELLEKAIQKLEQNRIYFSYRDIKILLDLEKISITPSSLKSYLFELSKKKAIYNAGKGWYSAIEKPFELNIKPVQVIIRKIKKAFPLLNFSGWSTEQLNTFTHHLLSKFIVFLYVDSDYIRNIADFLESKNFNVYTNPDKSEIEKRFTISEKTVVIRPTISKQPQNNDNIAPIEKILIDFLIENKKLNIMEDSEAENVVKKAINSGSINISKFYSYAKRRRFILPIAINQVHNNINMEMVD